MEWQWTPYTLPYVGVGLAALLMAAYIGRQKSLPVVRSKRMLLVVGAIWIFGYAFELSAVAPSGKLLGALVQTIGFAFAPMSFLFYAVRYAGHDPWMNKRSILLVSVIPVLTILLALTSAFHKLILSDYTLATNGQFVYMVKSWGPAYFVFLGYAGLTQAVAVGLLIRNALRSRNMYVWQTVSFVVGAGVTLILGVMDSFGIFLIQGLQLSPLAVNLFSVVIGAYLLPLRRSEARSAAYTAAFNNLLDPIVVVDARGEVLDLNTAARPWMAPQAAPGFPLQLRVELADAVARLTQDPLAGREITLSEAGGLSLTYEIKSSPLRDGVGRVISRILIFHDISGRVRELQERREAEALIQTSLREKEVLLKEIHHRVKNNLQIISSLLQLQANQLNHPDAQAALRDSQYRVRSMALIHEKLYQSKDLAQVNLGDYIRSLSAQMLRSYQGNGRVELVLEVQAVRLGIDLAVPCGLILNELISNALKHAFPADRRGQVLIELHAMPGSQARLRVADDGVGLPPGVDWQTTPSLGLQLVSNLVEQLEGQVTLDRTQGTAFEINFPYE